MELIQAPPILSEVVIKHEGPAMDVLCEHWIIGVHEEEDAVIIEVGIQFGGREEVL